MDTQTMQDAVAITAHRKRCWEILDCPPQARAACAAPLQPEIPCFAARQIAGQPLLEGCGTCPARALTRTGINVANRV
jgi:hypothetical protein